MTLEKRFDLYKKLKKDYNDFSSELDLPNKTVALYKKVANIIALTPIIGDELVDATLSYVEFSQEDYLAFYDLIEKEKTISEDKMKQYFNYAKEHAESLADGKNINEMDIPDTQSEYDNMKDDTPNQVIQKIMIEKVMDKSINVEKASAPLAVEKPKEELSAQAIAAKRLTEGLETISPPTASTQIIDLGEEALEGLETSSQETILEEEMESVVPKDAQSYVATLLSSGEVETEYQETEYEESEGSEETPEAPKSTNTDNRVTNTSEKPSPKLNSYNAIHPDALGLFFGSATRPKWNQTLFANRMSSWSNLESKKAYLLSQTAGIIKKYGIQIFVYGQRFGPKDSVMNIFKENHEILQLFTRLKLGQTEELEGEVKIQLKDLVEYRGLIAGNTGAMPNINASISIKPTKSTQMPAGSSSRQSEPLLHPLLKGGIPAETRLTFKGNPTSIDAEIFKAMARNTNKQRTTITGKDTSEGAGITKQSSKPFSRFYTREETDQMIYGF